MSVSTFLDVFTVNAQDAATTTYARTGYGFQPKGFIVWAFGRSETTDTVGSSDVRGSIGFGSSTSRRLVHACSSFDDLATSITNHALIEDAIIATISNGDAVDGKLDVSAIGSDGITFIVDDQFPVDLRVAVFAFGGSDITNVEVGATQDAGTTGNDTFNNADNFQPDITFFTMSGSTTSGAVTSHNRLNFGYGISSSKRGVIQVSDRDALTIPDTKRYSNDLECVGRHVTTSPARRADFVSNNASPGGVTINWLENASAQRVGWMMVKGGLWDAGNLATRTDGNDIAVTGLAFQPRGLLFFGHGTTESTQDTTQTEAVFSFGAATSASSRHAQAWGADTIGSTANTENSTAIEYDACYIDLDLADGLEALMDLKSIESDGFTCVMDDVDAGASFVQWIAVGDSGGGANHTLKMMLANHGD